MPCWPSDFRFFSYPSTYTLDIIQTNDAESTQWWLNNPMKGIIINAGRVSSHLETLQRLSNVLLFENTNKDGATQRLTSQSCRYGEWRHGEPWRHLARSLTICCWTLTWGVAMGVQVWGLMCGGELSYSNPESWSVDRSFITCFFFYLFIYCLKKKQGWGWEHWLVSPTPKLNRLKWFV